MTPYVAEMKRRREEPGTLLGDGIEKEALAFHTYKRILSCWNLPPLLEMADGRLYETPPEFSQPDAEIDGLLKDAEIATPDKDGEEEFLREFRTACKLAKKLTSNPEREDLRQAYKKAKKLRSLICDISKEMERYDAEEFAYISDIFQRQLNNFTELVGQPKIENSLSQLRHRAVWLDAAIRTSDHIAEDYLRKHQGGHAQSRSRRAALNAITESFWRCYGVAPTSTLDSPKERNSFIQYGTVLYAYLGNEDDETLYKDAKESIKKLKSKKS